MKHPDERRIALYACGDAGWLDRVATGRHIRSCDACRHRAETFRRDRRAIRQEAAELPEGLEWNRLAAEMTANIHVGLEAGECVSELRVARVRPVGWRPAIAATALAALVLFAAYLNFPQAQRTSLARGIGRIWVRPAAVEAGVALAATRNGIEVRENGAALTMVNPGQSPTVVVVNTSGSLRARYVDDDTGQVTITNVYAQ